MSGSRHDKTPELQWSLFGGWVVHSCEPPVCSPLPHQVWLHRIELCNRRGPVDMVLSQTPGMAQAQRCNTCIGNRAIRPVGSLRRGWRAGTGIAALWGIAEHTGRLSYVFGAQVDCLCPRRSKGKPV